MNEIAEQVQNAAERGTRQAKKTVEHAALGAENISQDIQDHVSAAAKSAEAYRSKVFQYMRENVNAALDYAHSLASVKSPSEFVELSTSHARKQLKTITAQTGEHDLSAAAKAADEYRSKVFEFVKANMADTLQYAQRLANVKSPSEFIELSTRHARKQFETMTAQTAELTSLAQKLTACNTEQLTGGFSDASTVPHQGS